VNKAHILLYHVDGMRIFFGQNTCVFDECGFCLDFCEFGFGESQLSLRKFHLCFGE